MTFPLVKPSSTLRALSLSCDPSFLELPHEPLVLESIILRHLGGGPTILLNLLNSKHLTCIVLHNQTIFGVELFSQWLEGLPFYSSLRTFSFAMKTGHISGTFILPKLLLFLSNHSFITYLDIDIYVDDHFGQLGTILRQMTALELFGFTTSVSHRSHHPNHENIFEYLRPILSSLPSRLGGLEIGTWYWLKAPAEVREPCATRETTRTNS